METPTHRPRARLRLTAVALILVTCFWAGLVAVGFAFDARWPEDRQTWEGFIALAALATAGWMLCFVVLAGSERIGWMAVGIVAYLSGAIVLRLLELAAYLYRGRLEFDDSARRMLIAIIVGASLTAVAGRMMTPDPTDPPPARTATVRVAAWLAAMGVAAGSVWLAGRVL